MKITSVNSYYISDKSQNNWGGGKEYFIVKVDTDIGHYG